jgi:sugar phosphate isomerase/epimerase
MHRREFMGACAAGALSAAFAHAGMSLTQAAIATPASAPALSVMLWTIARDKPFDQRIAMIADAGYRAVELVNEYKNWSSAEYAAARRQLHQLGMAVDACSGIDASLVDPSQRDLLLEQIRAKLPILAELECSSNG